MNELRLPKHLADEMVAHCEDGRPNEACGLLAGTGDEIARVLKMTNAAGSPVRYSLDPKEQFLAYREIEEAGLELGGVFHSHTHTQAVPSPTDIRLASEDVPYVIVSLAETPASIRAFRIQKESWTAAEGTVTEVPIRVE